jgi:shikimate dehydrogenase
MTITGKARVAGIIGWPVAHSLSPLLHGHWLAEYGIDGALVPLAVRPEDFALVIDGLRRAGFRGANITVPHKEAAFALAHRSDRAAAMAGAANLLVFHPDGTTEARNTDALGLEQALREKTGALAGKRAVLVGAGGAARGAALALEALGAGEIAILNRDAKRARNLTAALQPHLAAKLTAGGLDDFPAAAAAAALLVNASAAGMGGNPALALDLAALPQAALVCDIVYHPLETPLLKQAAALGHGTIDGLGMLMHQAVPAFEAFFGVRPAVTEGLRAALVKELQARG